MILTVASKGVVTRKRGLVPPVCIAQLMNDLTFHSIHAIIDYIVLHALVLGHCIAY